ncbi:hypothetical protein ACXR2T_07970 [Leucobacter sp. HY1910]
MSYMFDPAPVGAHARDWNPNGLDEQEILEDLFREITVYDHERRAHHDADGFFADFAFSDACRALGHERGTPPAGESFDPYEDDPQFSDGTHDTGWDGEIICLDTRRGVACTVCEDHCAYADQAVPLWRLVQAVPTEEEPDAHHQR